MELSVYRKPVEQELDSYYSTFDPCTEILLEKLNRMAEECADASSYEKKTRMYELLCAECPIHLFKETDYFFEISSGRPRHSWGGLQSPVGSFWHQRTADLWINPYLESIDADRKDAFIWGYSPVSFDHHCPGYDTLLQLGINGIIRRAEEQLAACEDPKKQAFYRCVIRANRALLALAGRFAKEARRLAAQASSPKEKAHFEKIAAAAENVPANPPATFYEGMCTVLFYRECVGSIDGIGFSTFGQLDRMLLPLYEADLAAGRTTPEEAQALIAQLLLYTEVRFEAATGYYETSTTIELGGCDREGNLVYNDLTALFLDTLSALRTVGTKINCRISSGHPHAYLEKIARIQAEELPSMMMHNDDVLIPARERCGQDTADVRMYVGGGCHEIVLQGTEVSTRADTWISLPRLLLRTMEHAGSCTTYEEFYRLYIEDVKRYHDKITALKNEAERHWCEYDPLVLYSSTIQGSLENGLDVTEGGAKYSTITLSMLGTATTIDSLYAIRQLVFEEKKLTMEEFLQTVESDFAGQEVLRRYILRRIPKHATNNEELNRFSADVLEDLSKVSGQTNARGGKYMPAFYPHDIYRMMGEITGATPDGRRANTPLSRGVSPSEFIETESPLDVIHSLKPIDFTSFADSFITEITLPRMEDKEKCTQILLSIIDAFLDARGSSLQFNLIDHDLLLEARRHPDQHRDLLVRVCGYSAAFVFLNESTQNEIIARAVR